MIYIRSLIFNILAYGVIGLGCVANSIMGIFNREITIKSWNYVVLPTVTFLLKHVAKITIEVRGKEYNVYTQVYVEGKFTGFELLRVNSVELISLDHIHSMHELYPTFLTTHPEIFKLSQNILKHRLDHPDMRIDQFATHYYNKIYPNIAIDDRIATDVNDIKNLILKK